MKKSVQILAAGGVEFVDDNYRGSGHSPFTHFLLNELKHNNETLLTASELALNIKKAVANNVQQTPESGILQGAGDELGEFIFTRLSLDLSLPPGATGSSGGILPTPSVMPVTPVKTTPPFWKSPWFWVGTLTATVATGYVLNRGGGNDDGDVVYK